MYGYDVEALVEHLDHRGLRHLADGRCADIPALVDAARGPLQPCDWLHLGQMQETGFGFRELASALPTDQSSCTSNGSRASPTIGTMRACSNRSRKTGPPSSPQPTVDASSTTSRPSDASGGLATRCNARASFA